MPGELYEYLFRIMKNFRHHFLFFALFCHSLTQTRLSLISGWNQTPYNLFFMKKGVTSQIIMTKANFIVWTNI